MLIGVEKKMEKVRYKESVWRDMIYNWVLKTLIGKSDRVSGKKPLWITTCEIRIMWERTITKNTVDLVSREIKNVLDELNLGFNFKINLFGDHWYNGSKCISVSEYIRPALQGNGINYEKLFELSYDEPYRTARQHADVYITSKPFHDDYVSWGCSMFEYGCLLLTLHGNRQDNHHFLRGIVRHEMGHLLGMPFHCEHVGIYGYTYDSKCNMHYSVPSFDLCPKCKLFLRVFWENIDKMLE
jgi:hypothetical protein